MCACVYQTCWMRSCCSSGMTMATTRMISIAKLRPHYRSVLAPAAPLQMAAVPRRHRIAPAKHLVDGRVPVDPVPLFVGYSRTTLRFFSSLTHAVLVPPLACSSRHNGLGVLQDLVSTPPMPPWLPSTARKPRQVAVAESAAAASKPRHAAVGHDHDRRCPVSRHRRCITVDDPR